MFTPVICNKHIICPANTSIFYIANIPPKRQKNQEKLLQNSDKIGKRKHDLRSHRNETRNETNDNIIAVIVANFPKQNIQFRVKMEVSTINISQPCNNSHCTCSKIFRDESHAFSTERIARFFN